MSDEREGGAVLRAAAGEGGGAPGGAGGGAACAIPAVAWWAYVGARTPPDGTAWLSKYPFNGLIARTIDGFHAPHLRLVAGLENLALAGIWAALACVLYLAWTRRFGLLELAALLFAGFASALGRFDICADAYAAGRTMSPLLVLVALAALRDGRAVFALPIAMVVPRILLQYWAQLKGVL